MTVLANVPTDRIAARAEQMHPGRAVLTLAVAPFFAIGWCARRALRGLRFVAAAVVIGWEAGGPPQ